MKVLFENVHIVFHIYKFSHYDFICDQISRLKTISILFSSTSIFKACLLYSFIETMENLYRQ